MPAFAALRAARVRLAWVDQLRGAAVLLMVLDHVLVQVAPGHLLRFTLTRLSLPLFMVCVAAVGGWGLSIRRQAQLGAAVVVEALLLGMLGMAQPGPVALIALVLVVVNMSGSVRSHPATVGLLGLVQALYLPLAWAGYQPGLLLAWWAIGTMATVEAEAWAGRLPDWLAAVGRRPLAWYCGHLLVLALIFGAR